MKYQIQYKGPAGVSELKEDNKSETDQNNIKGTVLVVDDEVQIIRALKRVLRNQPYKVLSASSAREALFVLDCHVVDVVLLDYWMPEINGLQLARVLSARHPGVVRIMLTGCMELDVIQTAVQRHDIYRYLIKPWDDDEFLNTIREAVALSKYSKGADDYSTDSLSSADSGSPAAPDKNQLEPLYITRVRPGWAAKILELVVAVETRDPYTHGHSSRVSELSQKVGEKIGLSHQELNDLEMGALLHDVGKLAIPDSILFKPSRLLPEEFDSIKQHPISGQDMMEQQTAPPKLCAIVRSHHENFDGSGYPDGIKGQDIQLGARIIRLADSFDAMHHKRKYRDAMPIEKITDEIEKGLGSQYDPDLTPIFLSVIKEMPSICT